MANTDLEGNPLPPNTQSMVISHVAVDKRREDIYTLVNNDIPNDPVSALALMSLGIGLLRWHGIPPATVTMLFNNFLDETKHLPDVGREGRRLTAEDMKKVPFEAPGNNTLN
jgi:hypothetical protein